LHFIFVGLGLVLIGGSVREAARPPWVLKAIKLGGCGSEVALVLSSIIQVFSASDQAKTVCVNLDRGKDNKLWSIGELVVDRGMHLFVTCRLTVGSTCGVRELLG
jgi:hypothetical protein